MDIALHIGDIVIQPTVVNGFLITLALCLLVIAAGSKVKKADPRLPSKGIVLFLELLVTGIEGLVKLIVGAENLHLAPFVGTLGLFLIVANFSGLLGISPPTSDFNVTLALAVFTIGMMWLQGFKAAGVGKTLKGAILGDYPALAPINLIGEISKPVSLSVRLFGNIMSGGVILGLVYAGAGWAAPIFTPLLHGIFDIFFGVIQAAVFLMLTMIWTQGMIDFKNEN